MKKILFLLVCVSQSVFGYIAYVVNNDNDTVSFFDTDTDLVLGTIPVGLEPIEIAITPDGKTAYITNSSSNNVSPLILPSNLPQAAIPVGTTPVGIAITPGPVFRAKAICLRDKYATQTDLAALVTWTPSPSNPVRYLLYRNAALTDLAGIVLATDPLQFIDHQREPNTLYTYYIVLESGLGGPILLGSASVTCFCDCN